MRLEIDIAEHHYNNIMALDSVSLGRVPYKGIIMYSINAIKHGKVLEQEPTTKNDLGVDCVSRADVLKLMQDNWHTHNGDWAMQESMDDIRALPSVTPQEPILDKIRAEIKKQQYGYMGGTDYEEGVRFGLMLAHQILDKYKAETEKT